MSEHLSVFWFRRDLRLDDNLGFYHALCSGNAVLPIFIFDDEILELLPRDDARVSFIHQTVQSIRLTLQKEYQSSLAIYHHNPQEVFKHLLKTYNIKAVYANHDYEPYAISRDSSIKTFLNQHGVPFHTFKDQVIFEKNEVVKKDGKPYTVYTPYMKRWKEIFETGQLPHINNMEPYMQNLIQVKDLPNCSLQDIGSEKSAINIPQYKLSPAFIKNYEDTRNYPAIKDGTSRLGIHLRFGTVSIRKIMKKALAEDNDVFWKELIWREFFMQILWHFPKTINNAFKPKYDRIEWRNNEDDFQKWKSGNTGFALVDAGMRELNATGFMHNRVRMLAASFLCKHLLIDWRWGEAYFARKLLDYEMASNVGNWQWAAGSGVDAAPYFRIFNPNTQLEKFDPQKEYVSKWVPEFQKSTYPDKMVDHRFARARCLDVYKKALL